MPKGQFDQLFRFGPGDQNTRCKEKRVSAKGDLPRDQMMGFPGRPSVDPVFITGGKLFFEPLPGTGPGGRSRGQKGGHQKSCLPLRILKGPEGAFSPAKPRLDGRVAGWPRLRRYS